MMMSSSEMSVFAVGCAMCAGTYTAPLPMGMFQMLVLANGQRYLLRVPGGVGDGVGGLDGHGVDDAVGVDAVGVDAVGARELALALGVTVDHGEAVAICPSTEPGEFPTVGLAVTAVCTAA
jgi:hypothetical protein